MSSQTKEVVKKLTSFHQMLLIPTEKTMFVPHYIKYSGQKLNQEVGLYTAVDDWVKTQHLPSLPQNKVGEHVSLCLVNLLAVFFAYFDFFTINSNHINVSNIPEVTLVDTKLLQLAVYQVSLAKTSTV